MKQYIDIYPDIETALHLNLPVVALESTIVSHGLPYPENVHMVMRVGEIIRRNGAYPATIAIVDGRIKIGLSKEDLERLATEKNVRKVSRRDLAYAIAKKELGATTVATTMFCAALAGIKFFVTGGIGGVHRGYSQTMDVSADLEELANTEVTVVCAGAKAILDLPRTLEYLETKGVPVIGYQTDVLPAFYSRTSPHRLNLRADSPQELAEIIRVKRDLDLRGGLLVMNPIPEEYSLDEAYINRIIDEAITEANEQAIYGKDLTPFLLKTIVDKTEGQSLEANLHLVDNNAKLGAEIAVAFQALRRG
ncbi:MAG TPA: pseudouridine-5'-phosphate glycosidase [Tissierellia bacterium]|nr:pseudouridine-5'-phosphate glycosidase [Tissierellia bacterium]